MKTHSHPEGTHNISAKTCENPVRNTNGFHLKGALRPNPDALHFPDASIDPIFELRGRLSPCPTSAHSLSSGTIRHPSRRSSRVPWSLRPQHQCTLTCLYSCAGVAPRPSAVNPSVGGTVILLCSNTTFTMILKRGGGVACKFVLEGERVSSLHSEATAGCGEVYRTQISFPENINVAR
jgi:hypothetical protein